MNNKVNTDTGLEQKELADIVTILKQNNAVNKITLFGSRAMGNYKNGSDIDISLQGESLSHEDIVNLSLEIDELYLPFKVDLIIFDRIEDSKLLNHIHRVGKVLYSRI